MVLLRTNRGSDLPTPILGCFAILPLPHVQESIDFIRYANSLETPPDGFAAATAMGKLYLGDPQLEPVWQELDKTGSMIFIHPSDTAMPPNLNFGPCEKAIF